MGAGIDHDGVWQGVMDAGRFLCTVIRTQPYRGVLNIADTQTNAEIFRAEVGLAYDARFGPDVDDVGQWQQMCEQAVDEYLAKAEA